MACAPLIICFSSGAGLVNDPAEIFALLGAAAFLTVATLGLLSREAPFAASLFGLSSWILLPAIAGLFQPRAEEPQTEPDS